MIPADQREYFNLLVDFVKLNNSFFRFSLAEIKLGLNALGKADSGPLDFTTTISNRKAEKNLDNKTKKQKSEVIFKESPEADPEKVSRKKARRLSTPDSDSSVSKSSTDEGSLSAEFSSEDDREPIKTIRGQKQKRQLFDPAIHCEYL